MKEETYLKQMDSFIFDIDIDLILKKKKTFLNKHVSICLPNAGFAMRKKSFSFVYLEK